MFIIIEICGASYYLIILGVPYYFTNNVLYPPNPIEVLTAPILATLNFPRTQRLRALGPTIFQAAFFYAGFCVYRILGFIGFTGFKGFIGFRVAFVLRYGYVSILSLLEPCRG